jgi:EmrB/QacA subfamily drug resistance transporter
MAPAWPSTSDISLVRRKPSQKIAVAVIYVCGMFMNSLDATIVNVALPTLGREFDRSPAKMEAVIIGYLVSLAIFIPSSGWLGDRFGTKRIFLLALAIFTTASVLCGMADSLGQLIAFRILQGAGGGLLTPVGMAMLYRTFPPEERVRVARILMFALILGPASGPVLGGLLIEQLDWRWIFFVNAPVGIAAFLFGLAFIDEHREPGTGRFDLPGFVLGGLGLGLVMYALTEGPVHGWGSPRIIGVGIAGVTVFTAFVLFELRTAEPMVQLRLLKNRLFGSTMLVSFFGTAAFLGTLFLTPLFLQAGRGVSPLTSGLTTFPEAIGVVVSTQLVARLYPRIGPRRLMAGGLAGVGIVAAMLSFLDFEGSLWAVRALMFLLGVSMAYIFLPNQVASMATISREATGRASTLFSVQRQLGGAAGVALVSTVLAGIGIATVGTGGDVAVPNLDAYRFAYLAAAGIAAIGAVLALRVPDADAAVTMRPRSEPPPAREPAAMKAD